jgi:hypothetical protein
MPKSRVFLGDDLNKEDYNERGEKEERMNPAKDSFQRDHQVLSSDCQSKLLLQRDF